VYGRFRWLYLSLAWAEVQELAFVVREPRPRWDVTATSEKSGQKFMSLAFREAEEQQAKPKPKAPTNTDPDIPF
jgi:hypothetical protein